MQSHWFVAHNFSCFDETKRGTGHGYALQLRGNATNNVVNIGSSWTRGLAIHPVGMYASCPLYASNTYAFKQLLPSRSSPCCFHSPSISLWHSSRHCCPSSLLSSHWLLSPWILLFLHFSITRSVTSSMYDPASLPDQVCNTQPICLLYFWLTNKVSGWLLRA